MHDSGLTCLLVNVGTIDPVVRRGYRLVALNTSLRSVCWRSEIIGDAISTLKKMGTPAAWLAFEGEVSVAASGFTSYFVLLSPRTDSQLCSLKVECIPGVWKHQHCRSM